MNKISECGREKFTEVMIKIMRIGIHYPEKIVKMLLLFILINRFCSENFDKNFFSLLLLSLIIFMIICTDNTVPYVGSTIKIKK